MKNKFWIALFGLGLALAAIGANAAIASTNELGPVVCTLTDRNQR
jgi:hypothetical protein